MVAVDLDLMDNPTTFEVEFETNPFVRFDSGVYVVAINPIFNAADDLIGGQLLFPVVPGLNTIQYSDLELAFGGSVPPQFTVYFPSLTQFTAPVVANDMPELLKRGNHDRRNFVGSPSS